MTFLHQARLASLGGLTSLEALDMDGCRGGAETLETAVWSAIHTRAGAAEVDPPAPRQLRVIVDELRVRARELLQLADELEECIRRER